MLNSELLHITLCCALEKAGVRFYSSGSSALFKPDVQSLLREFVKIEEVYVRRLTKLMATHGGRGCRLERKGVNFYRRLLGVQYKTLEEVIKKLSMRKRCRRSDWERCCVDAHKGG